MAIIQPIASDRTISPGHSFLHRVFATDDAAPEQSIIVGPDGTISISESVLLGSNANLTDFPEAKFISSVADTGHTYPHPIGIIGESVSGTEVGNTATGVGGVAATNGAGIARGLCGVGKVTNTGDTGAAIGVWGRSIDTHAGDSNIGIYSTAQNGGTNYSFYGAAGVFYNADSVGIGTATPDTTLQIVGTTRTGEDTTNYTNFDTTGHQTMSGTARPWKDQLSDALNLRQSGTGVSTNTNDNTIEFLKTANLSDYIYTNVQLNHDRDETSTISPHIHWFSGDGANIPNFLLQYRWQVIGGDKNTGWTNLKCNTPVFANPGAGITKHQICESATDLTPPTGSNISDIVQFRVLRDNANTSGVFTGADPYTGTVGILAFDVHYQINSIGSTDEFAK